MVVLLPQPFLVAFRRGALLPCLAVRGLAACAAAADADRGELGDLAWSHAGPRDRSSHGSRLVDNRRPNSFQAGWLGIGCLSGGDGAPTRGAGSAGASPAEGRGRGRWARRAH